MGGHGNPERAPTFPQKNLGFPPITPPHTAGVRIGFHIWRPNTEEIVIIKIVRARAAK
jgi:hypothetical protein